MTNRAPRIQLLTTHSGPFRRLGVFLGHGVLLGITSLSAVSVLLILVYASREALPFFRMEGLKEFFTTNAWYPTYEPPQFGALAIFFGSAVVTAGAVLLAVPTGVAAAVCLSDILPFTVRQYVKPVIEMLAAIPSVAYGFFAMVVLAPLFQEHGGRPLAWVVVGIGTPLLVLAALVVSDLTTARAGGRARLSARVAVGLVAGSVGGFWLWKAATALATLRISSGTNALNVSLILAVMALPTIVSVCDDALSAVGRELREGSYALGATRAETLVKVVIPAARGGIIAAVILGAMRAIGETMVVWMASGMATQIPSPWYDLTQPVRTLTATIAQEMGETDQSVGAAHYHALYALAFCLLCFSFAANLVSEWASRLSITKRKAR